MWKKTFIIVICCIFYLPISLNVISSMSDFSCDVALKGYTATVEAPKLTWKSYIDGEFQSNYTAWSNQIFKPKGVATKTYSTIQYNLFNMGNRPIGNNHDIFQWEYINSELCINDAQDLSISENQISMKSYVEKLELVQSLLAQHGKFLYLYITPNKADFNYDNLLNAYIDVSNENAIKPIDYFSNLIADSDIPYIICRDERNNLDYPAFYTTGIHWSRTYEQKISSMIVDDLAELTNKKYRRIILGDVNQNSTPYWRDTDVYDLLNVWNKSEDQIYYEYQEERDDADNYDKIKILVQGTSFGEGLLYDINTIYPYEDIYYMIRSNTIYNYSTNEQELIESWDSFDITNYLNNVDVIVIETTEAELTSYSWGFLDYLIDFLPSYKPAKFVGNYIDIVDCSNEDAWNTNSLRGFNEFENGVAWTKDYSQVILDTENLKDNGLEIEFVVPQCIFENCDEDEISIFVNGRNVYKDIFTEAWEGSVVIDKNKLFNNDDLYYVEIYCKNNTNLGIQIKYIGRER